MGEVIDLEERLLEKLPPRVAAGRLMALPVSRRLEVLLARQDAEAVVAAMAEQDFYLFVKEAGGDGALPLLALARPEQFIHIMDLEGWEQDRLRPGKALAWCAAFLEADEGRFLGWLYRADFELLVLLFREWLDITDLPEDSDAADATDMLPRESLDNRYFFTIRYPQYRELLHYVLRYLFESHNGFYLELMHHARWGQGSEVEELAYRFHCSRLEDNGIPEPAEAATIYRAILPERIRTTKSGPPEPEDSGASSPAFALALLPGQGLLHEVLAGIDAPETLRTVQFELAALANKVVVADGLQPDEPEVLRQAVDKVAAYVNLGLEEFCGGAPEAAAKALRQVWLEELFRLAHARIAAIRDRMSTLVKNGWIARWPLGIQCLDEVWQEPASLLLGRTPMLLRDGGQNRPSTEADFARTPADLHALTEMVAMFAAVGPLFDSMAAGPEGHDWASLATGLWPEGQIHDLETVTLGALLFTAAARLLWEGRWHPAPLPVASWPEILAQLGPAQLTAALTDHCRTLLPDPEAVRLATRYLAPILAQYRETTADALADPRLALFFLFADPGPN